MAAVLAVLKGRNGEQTGYYNYFRIVWQVSNQSLSLPLSSFALAILLCHCSRKDGRNNGLVSKLHFRQCLPYKH